MIQLTGTDWTIIGISAVASFVLGVIAEHRAALWAHVRRLWAIVVDERTPIQLFLRFDAPDEPEAFFKDAVEAFKALDVPRVSGHPRVTNVRYNKQSASFRTGTWEHTFQIMPDDTLLYHAPDVVVGIRNVERFARQVTNAMRRLGQAHGMHQFISAQIQATLPYPRASVRVLRRSRFPIDDYEIHLETGRADCKLSVRGKDGLRLEAFDGDDLAQTLGSVL